MLLRILPLNFRQGISARRSGDVVALREKAPQSEVLPKSIIAVGHEKCIFMNFVDALRNDLGRIPQNYMLESD